MNYVSLNDFNVVADGVTCQRQKIVDAIDLSISLGQPLYFPGYPGKVFIDNSTLGAIEIYPDTHWQGVPSRINKPGSKLLIKGPGFKNSPSNYLSNFQIDGICFEGSDTNDVAGKITGGNHCFDLYGVTNNSSFKRIYVQWFNGDGFRFSQQTANPADKTVCSNVVFEQTFITSCGGYAFNINGFSHAVWMHPDVNSCVQGAFKIKGGASNQCNISIYNGWFEGGAAWASKQPILIEDGGNYPVNFFGSTFGGPVGGTDVIKITGQHQWDRGLVGLHGVSGFGYTNWLNDTVGIGAGPILKAMGSRGHINYLHD